MKAASSWPSSAELAAGCSTNLGERLCMLGAGKGRGEAEEAAT